MAAPERMPGAEARVDPHAGGHRNLGGRSEGTEGHHQTTECRVRVVRAKPGGGGATERRSVEPGRTSCGVRAWSQRWTGTLNKEKEVTGGLEVKSWARNNATGRARERGRERNERFL